jgi:hypothetical protein
MKSKEGMNQILKDMGNKSTQKGISFSDGTAVLADTALQELSKRDYKKHYRGLRLFCCLIGDCESLLMLQDNAPRPYCPSMSSKTISNFIKWKRGAKGSILKGSDNVPIKDIDNQIVKCEWG